MRYLKKLVDGGHVRRATYLQLAYIAGCARVGDECFEILPIPARICGKVSPDDPNAVFSTMPASDRYFIDCILYDQPVMPDFWGGVAVQAVIVLCTGFATDAAKEAHHTGRWVNVAPARS